MIPYPRIASGKVREIHQIDSTHLLFVATDRISAYDCILTPTIPDKGAVLTGISRFFFESLGTPSHFVSTDLRSLDLDGGDRFELAGRAMIVRKAEVIPMECVVRGYLHGSAWAEYRAGGGPTTAGLPPGLEIGARLPEPLFTPATKAESGHDRNVDQAEARNLLGDEMFEELRSRSITVYRAGAEHAASRGVILADTKFEFGMVDGEVVLVDEVMTPDSSRYWPADQWQPGSPIPSFDKQYVRDWLDSTKWDRDPPAPVLPDEIVVGTRARYVEAFERITDLGFEEYVEEHER